MVKSCMTGGAIPNYEPEILKLTKQRVKAFAILNKFFQKTADNKYYFCPLLACLDMQLNDIPYSVVTKREPTSSNIMLEGVDIDNFVYGRRKKPSIILGRGDKNLAPVYSPKKEKDLIVESSRKQLIREAQRMLSGVTLEYAIALIKNNKAAVVALYPEIKYDRLPYNIKVLQNIFFKQNKEFTEEETSKFTVKETLSYNNNNPDFS